MQHTKVLLAEDDYDFGSILKQYLMIHQFEVIWAKNGQEAFEFFTADEHQHENAFDICVFDVMMPKLDGFSLAEKVIQHNPEVPFIFLTAKKMKEDKIRGLKLGADDYIVKPFEADILVLRLQNILKRTKKIIISSKNEQEFSIGAYVFDTVNYQLKLNGETQRITEKEAQLIQYFYDHKNQMIKREDVLENVWGTDDFFSGRSMDVFISRLRKYFKKDPNIAIESTRGVGLTFKIIEN
ncbi:response regulator transcription factor [Kordia algicida OT-1]|uniref:Two-component system response regulator n=1 Tax=Kordia algicida OT-1 TaxID=391587 RepID=A9DNK6_9FLAO|nr:response regulator transcription factor [Kordia algicida]EDP97215.1 two-component system response regulator [Kordia algicida OT-1]